MGRLNPFLTVGLIVILMKPDMAFSQSIYGSVDIIYQSSETETAGKASKTDSLFQGYSLGFSRRFTSAIDLSGNMRVAISTTDSQESKTYLPQLFLTLSPEYFRATVGYNITDSYPPGGSRTTTSTLSTTFSIPTVKWPSLSLSYNETDIQDHFTPNRIDTTSSNAALSSGYNLSLFDTPINLMYSFGDLKSENRVENTTEERPSHLGTIALTRSFWENRVQTGANFGYSYSQSVYESLVGPTLFEEEKVASGGLFSWDGITQNISTLSLQPGLIDNSFASFSGSPNLNNLYNNIGVGFITAQAIHKIYLYTDTVPTSDLTWTLYTSSDNITWTPVGTPTVTYEAAASRFVFTFTETQARYFKVVNTTVHPTAVNVVEIKAIGYVISTLTARLEATTKRDFGGFNLYFRPWDWTTLSYNISYDHSSYDLTNLDVTSMNQGISLSAIAIPKYLTISTTYWTYLSKSSNVDKTEVDSYTISLTSTPLPTLNGNLSYGHSESLIAERPQSISDSIGANVFMNLYKGIDLGLGASVSEFENRVEKSETQSIGYSGNLRLVPWRPLNIIVEAGGSSSETEKEGAKTSATSKTLRTSVTYNPTRALYLAATFNIEPTTSQSYTMNWVPTRVIQLGLRYTSFEITDTIGGDISWTPLNWMTFRMSYSETWIDNPTNDHSKVVMLSGSLRF